MRKITFQRVKEINWASLVRKNAYPIVSCILLLVYFYATISAILFIVGNLRQVFEIDEKIIESQTVTFDSEGYEKIARRLELPPR